MAKITKPASTEATAEPRKFATKEAKALFAAKQREAKKAEAAAEKERLEAEKKAEEAANPKPEKKPRAERASKFTSPIDQLALKIVDKIRDDRSMFAADETKTSETGSITKSFSATIGAAHVSIGRNEIAGKKSREFIARAFIHVKPEGGKALEITGPLAARAWFALTHESKGHGKTVPDIEAVNDAAQALGL